MNKILLGALFVVGVVVIGAVLYGGMKSPSMEEMVVYHNPTYGISFSYPKEYVLTEHEGENTERAEHTIVLTPKENSSVPPNSDGPATISITVFQNLEKEDLFTWLTMGSDSNFKLSDGTYTTTTVAQTEGVRYIIDGLYPAQVIAFETKDGIVMITGMYNSLNDQIVKDFENILLSFSLQ